MVDLVKIRKKKAKQDEEQRSQAASEVHSGDSGALHPAQAASAAPVSVSPAVSVEHAAIQSPASEATVAEGPALSKLERFKAEVGKRRTFDKARTEETEQQSQLELLTFVIAGEQYAVDIERIVEIVTPRSVTRIPNADDSVVGIMSLRGTIVTLVNVRRQLRHAEAGKDTEDTRIVVIDFRHEIVGFIVDRVLRVVKASAGDVERHPVVHATELDEAVRGVFRVAGALTILLDLDKLLDHGALTARSA